MISVYIDAPLKGICKYKKNNNNNDKEQIKREKGSTF